MGSRAMTKEKRRADSDDALDDDADRPAGKPRLGAPRRFVRRGSAILMSGIYVKAGWDAFKEPGGRPKKASNIGLPNPELMVRANGLGMVLAGSAFALGIKPRLSALVLAGLMVPTTLAGHRFWDEPPGPGRAAQEVQFLKNLGLIGGLLLYASSPRR